MPHTGHQTASAVRIRDDFWNAYGELVRNTVIPYQWDALNDRIPDAEPSHAIRNFRIAAGLEEGEFHGFIFQDSDLAKWLEAVGCSLAQHPDPALEALADEAIDLIGQAQQPDGYLNTYFTIKEPDKKWTNLMEAHEMYCAGHLIEAAVAYYRGTGKRKLLDIVCRLADHIDAVFGPEPGKRRGYCGHQEIELALVKLYEVTGEPRYLKLSQYFIDERGRDPKYFLEEWERRGRKSIWSQGTVPKPDLAYFQAAAPVREQEAATGHAVRAVYMYTAMADLARRLGDDSLKQACRRLWDNVTRKQMYITGGIGSTHHGEAFSFDYDLPNDTVYAETCASIGLIFFARRMLELEPRGEYADVMERALYNNVLGSMSRDGKHFFYVNPLEVWPEASKRNPGKHHVKPVRQSWFGCACCPPNIARLLSSLNEYIYHVPAGGRTVYVNLFIGSEASFELGEGVRVTLRQRSELPWQGHTTMKIDALEGAPRFELALRIPAWTHGQAALTINGVNVSYREQDGYAQVERDWQAGDTVAWTMPLRAVLTAARPQVRADAGRAAIARGPLVYCLEEADLGSPLSAYSLAAAAPNLSERFDAGLPGGGAVVIEADGYRTSEDGIPPDALYVPYESLVQQNVRLKAIPYYLWGNRAPGEMAVWIRAAK